MSFTFSILLGTLGSAANAVNSSSVNSNVSPVNATGKTTTANGSNKTVVVVSPGSKATIVTTGNKTLISNAHTPATSNSSSGTASFNRTGFGNLYVLTSTSGKTFPIKYTINGGKIVGMLTDKDRNTLVLVLDPGQNGGNMTIELPRTVIDSKGASNTDAKFQVKIDGKGVDYKEVANNMNARILSINFSKDNRFMEINGTRMTS